MRSLPSVTVGWMSRSTDLTSLFDPGPRTDGRVASNNEAFFDFLNRVDRPFFDVVRRQLDEWYRDFPEEHRVAVRSTFRSKDRRQTFGAFWEIYLHEAHRRLGFALEKEPSLPGSPHRPDFLCEKDGDSFYLEAMLVGDADDDGPERRRENAVLDAINTVKSRDFFIIVGEILARGDTVPSTAELAGPLGKRLNLLDWQIERARLERDEEPFEFILEARGWRIEIVVFTKSPKHRGAYGERIIGAGPLRGGMIDDRRPLRERLREKAGRYGELDRPYVIAVLVLRNFADHEDVMAALYGADVVRSNVDTLVATADRAANGLWTAGRRARARGVSGVLVALNLSPFTVTTTEPRMWLNPWGTHPLDAGSVPWEIAQAGPDDAIKILPSKRGAHSILGLPAKWPGAGPWR